MAIDVLLRIAAEQGLLVAGLVAGPGVERPGWRVACQRCRGWLALPARPPEPAWWVRRVCAFAVRHRHPPRGRPVTRPPGQIGSARPGPLAAAPRRTVR